MSHVVSNEVIAEEPVDVTVEEIQEEGKPAAVRLLKHSIVKGMKKKVKKNKKEKEEKKTIVVKKLTLDDCGFVFYDSGDIAAADDIYDDLCVNSPIMDTDLSPEPDSGSPFKCKESSGRLHKQ